MTIDNLEPVTSRDTLTAKVMKVQQALADAAPKVQLPVPFILADAGDLISNLFNQVINLRDVNDQLVASNDSLKGQLRDNERERSEAWHKGYLEGYEAADEDDDHITHAGIDV